jgi:predicted homoserine dehydrogenase-like protein
VPKDQALTFEDVERPEGRLIDQLWQEQVDWFTPEEEPVASAPEAA